MELQILIEKIKNKTELTAEEVMHNIKMKQIEYQNLINEEAAAKLIASENGISSEEEIAEKFLTLAEIISQKPPEADFYCKIAAVNSPKNFETERKKGKVCNIELIDHTSKGVLVLWDEDVRLLEKNAVERDDIIFVKGAMPKSYNPLEVHSSLITEITFMRPQEYANSKYYIPFPIQTQRLADAKSIHEGEIVDLYARVLQLTELREFKKEKGQGKVINVLLSDSNGNQIPLVLWDYHAESAEKTLKPGNAIKLENAIVKKGRDGNNELHLNWASNLVIEPKSHNLSEEKELLKDSLPTGRLLDLKASQRAIIKCTVGKITKAELKNGALIVDADLNDEINVPVRFSGRQALEILQLRSIPKLPIDLVLKLKEEYLKGKRVSLIVRKDKDAERNISKYVCEYVLNFI